MGKIFPSFSYLATYCTSLQATEIIEKYEKRGNYFPILYEATCDNYFIGNCLLKSNIARAILLTYLLTAPSLLNIILTYYKQKGAKTARISLATWLFFQLFDSVLFPYFSSNILYSVHLLCIQWPFVINLFSNNFFHAFDYFWKQVPTKLLISLC